MPLLRERGGDIRILAEHFVSRCARELSKTFRGIDPDSLDRLEEYSWPGNVRELQNVIERSAIVCESETFTLDPSWSHSEPPSLVPADISLESTLDEIQREAIQRALQSCDWIIGGPKGAAALLGLKRTTLQARMHKLGIARLRPAVRGEVGQRVVGNARHSVCD